MTSTLLYSEAARILQYMEMRSISIGNEYFSYTDHVVTLSRATVSHLMDLLKKRVALSPYEPTYTMRTYGIPSLVVRFDGVVDENETFQCYEVQAGCSWIGYAGVANPAFKEIRDTLAKKVWPPIKSLVHPTFKKHDDELWLDSVSVDEALRGTDTLMIRGHLFRELTHEKRMALIGRSVKPILDQNSKRYGIELGWWKLTDDSATLPWNESFVLKPMRGHGSKDVMIWDPHDRKGRATRTQIEKAMSRHVSMCMQQLIRPMHTQINGCDYNMILRPFFGYDTARRTWVPMHGVWLARPYPNLRIHGSSDAISGPLLMQ